MKVIVLGAGLLGVTSAYFLRQQGHDVTVIDRAQPGWVPPSGKAPVGKEIGAAVGAVVVMLVVGMIHAWLGYNPFGG